MKTIAQILVLLVLFLACKQHHERKIVKDQYKAISSAQQIQEKISRYYKNKLTDSLAALLFQWHEHVLPSTRDFSDQNDTLKNIFLVFEDLYKPFKFGNHNVENYFEGKNKYVVIQNEIKYDVISESEYERLVFGSSEGYPNDTAYEFYKPTRKLINFRPALSNSDTKCLYLTNEYKEAINSFLGLGSFKGDIIRNDTIFRRYNYLSPTLPVVYGHWGGYWHIETFPIIERILFDPDFEHAAVDFRYGLEDTMLQYRITKENGHWQPDNKWLKIRLE